jgi:hypothetical protein
VYIEPISLSIVYYLLNLSLLLPLLTISLVALNDWVKSDETVFPEDVDKVAEVAWEQKITLVVLSLGIPLSVIHYMHLLGLTNNLVFDSLKGIVASEEIWKSATTLFFTLLGFRVVDNIISSSIDGRVSNMIREYGTSTKLLLLLVASFKALYTEFFTVSFLLILLTFSVIRIEKRCSVTDLVLFLFMFLISSLFFILSAIHILTT